MGKWNEKGKGQRAKGKKSERVGHKLRNTWAKIIRRNPEIIAQLASTFQHLHAGTQLQLHFSTEPAFTYYTPMALECT